MIRTKPSNKAYRDGWDRIFYKHHGLTIEELEQAMKEGSIKFAKKFFAIADRVFQEGKHEEDRPDRDKGESRGKGTMDCSDTDRQSTSIRKENTI